MQLAFYVIEFFLKRSQTNRKTKETPRPIFGRNVKRSNQLELFWKQHLATKTFSTKNLNKRTKMFCFSLKVWFQTDRSCEGRECEIRSSFIDAYQTFFIPNIFYSFLFFIPHFSWLQQRVIAPSVLFRNLQLFSRIFLEFFIIKSTL